MAKATVEMWATDLCTMVGTHVGIRHPRTGEICPIIPINWLFPQLEEAVKAAIPAESQGDEVYDPMDPLPWGAFCPLY